MRINYSHRLIQFGVGLFLLGLITGFGVPLLTNPRVGLSSHLEGIQNGIFLILIGLVWPRLALNQGLAAMTFGLALYGTFANWLATLLAAVWGAGGAMMPIAAHAFQGTPMQEGVIQFLLLSLSVAMVLVCCFLLWGLRIPMTLAGLETIRAPKES